jgi:hypothetical protein
MRRGEPLVGERQYQKVLAVCSEAGLRSDAARTARQTKL